MNNKYYLIRLGGNLYVATKYYHFYQATSKGPERAYRFKTLEEAQKVCRKTINGKIEEYSEDLAENSYSEIDTLKETIIKQQKQIEELNLKIEKYQKDNDEHISTD